MDGSGACLETIEGAMARSSSPLARALRELGACTGGRGTCLVVEHDDFGEALIADQLWTMGRDETLRNREHFALVDLRQDSGLRRVAILVEPSGSENRLDDAGCALAVAALGVTSALAEIAEPFRIAGSEAERLNRDSAAERALISAIMAEPQGAV